MTMWELREWIERKVTVEQYVVAFFVTLFLFIVYGIATGRRR